MKLYLSGQMSGLPKFGFDLFDEAAQDLRQQNIEIISPAELDSPKTRELALSSADGAHGSGVVDGQTYGDFLSRDIKLVIDEAEGVVCLPNWKNSTGAKIETYTSYRLGKPIYRYLRGRKPARIPQKELEKAWLQ